jgi:vacuolar-type H+-ATPase subunit E/Vma4
MGIDGLLAALQRDTAAEAETILASARVRAAARVAAAEVEAARRRDEKHGALARERRAAIAREAAVVERETTARVLEARDTTIGEILDEARSVLAALPLPRWENRLPGLVEAALGFLPPEAVLEVPPAALAAARRLAGSRAGVEAAPAALAGVFGRAVGGRVEVDLTLPGLLDQRREELAARIGLRLDQGR